jgi:hypothetical protein
MKYFAFAFFIIFLFSCKFSSSEKQDKSTDTKSNINGHYKSDIDFTKGKLYSTIKLGYDESSPSVAIYIPINYSNSVESSLLIFFDSHAAGELAIEKYTELADRFHCILIGSNETKNGMSFDETFLIANNLVNYSNKVFGINKSRIFFVGQSGGAKVAIDAASKIETISKVIYCGAALPITSCNHPLQMLGFAGIRDMNYSEIVKFSMGSFPQNVKNYCVEWNGKHEWPDEQTFELAFEFINDNINAIRVAKFTDKQTQVINEEEKIHQQYILALQNYDVNFWSREIFRLNSQRATDKTGMTERLLGYISLACYSLSNQALQQNLFEDAGKILTIYKMADPLNPDCDFLQAKMFAKEKNSTKVYNLLRIANSEGLKDFSKIESDPDFLPYLNTSDMSEIRNLMTH